MGAGLPVKDLGFESPLCWYQLTKYPVRQNVGAVPGPCCGVCKGPFPGKLVASLYAVLSWACVHYRWRCVSLEEKTHLGRHLVVTPTNSLVICIQLHQAGLCEIVEGGAIPANVSA